MTQDRFGYWPDGSAYRTPEKPSAMAPICPACGSRHKGETVNCNLTNDAPEASDHDATD